MKISIVIISAVAAISGGTSSSISPQRRRTIQNKHQSNKQTEKYDPYLDLYDNEQSNRKLESSMSMMSMTDEEEMEETSDNTITDHDTTNVPKCTPTLMSKHPSCKTCLYACGEVTTKSCAFGEPGSCSFDCASFGDSFVEKQYCVVPQESMDGDMDMMSSTSIYTMDINVIVGLASYIVYAVIMM